MLRAVWGSSGGASGLLAEGLFHLIGERIVSDDLAPGARIRDGELGFSPLARESPCSSRSSTKPAWPWRGR